MAWLNRIFYALVAIAVIQSIYYYPRMPETVASHFDALGAANDWSGRNGFFGLYLVMVLMLVAVFKWVPRWSERRAQFGLKIPNPKYWLAPDRIEQTRLFFRRQMTLMGIAHLLLAIYTVQLVINANFDQAPRLHSGILALALYFLLMIGWLIYFYRHFRNP